MNSFELNVFDYFESMIVLVNFKIANSLVKIKLKYKNVLKTILVLDFKLFLIPKIPIYFL
jgi:hypothetical protein